MMKPIQKPPLSRNDCASGSSALHARIDAGKPARALALRRAIEPNDAARARRIADTESARLWLADGIPFVDAITMLEGRRRFELSPDHCRAYAVEIVSAVLHEISARRDSRFANREESHHAVA